MKEAIAVTGIGLVTPLGVCREETWKNLVEGRSGLTLIGGLPIPAAGKARIADKKGVSRDAVIAASAAGEALADAGIAVEAYDPERIGCTVSVSKPSPCPWHWSGMESAGRLIRQAFGIKGPGGNYSAACATGIVSVHAGMLLLREHAADICIAGSAEASLNVLYTAGFKNMGVVAEVRGDPREAVKPFAADRTGFLPGEGAGVFVLERLSSARKRGARIYGIIASCVIGNDCHHAVVFNSGGRNIGRVIHDAAALAGFDDTAVRGLYVSTHGTATQLNDRLETAALKYAFGDSGRITCSSTKAGTGHLLGAAGSVEAAFVLLAIRDGVLPPTLNLVNQDPFCDLDYTPLYARKKNISCGLSLSYGFGGHIGAITFKKKD